MQRQMKSHWAGTVSSVYDEVWKDYIFFIKTQHKWTLWPPPISLSSTCVAANSMFPPLPGTASFLPAPTVCVQLSCSSFFITTLGPGPSSSTNNAPDCCRPQKLCSFTVSKLWASPNSKGSCQHDDCCPWLCVWLPGWRLLTAPGADMDTSCVDLCLSSSWQAVTWHPSWAVSWGCWRWDTLLLQVPWPGGGPGKGGHMLDVNNSNCLWSLEFHFLILPGFVHVRLRSPPNWSLFSVS